MFSPQFIRMIHQSLFNRFGILVLFLTIHLSVFASKANEPIITLQPLSTPVCYGGNTSISAIATNADYYVLEKLNGATWETVSSATYLGGNTLTLAFNNVISTESYHIKFSNSAGLNSVTSNTFTVNVLRPNITAQPIDQNDCDGLSVSFKVTATGSGTLIYQWQRKKPTDADFVNITPLGATLSISSIGSSTNPHLSQYRCIITDGSGCTNTSSVATLTTNKILSANDPTLCSGSNISLNTSLRGTPTAYQWQKKLGSTWTNLTETADIVGVTNAVLQLNSMPLTDNNADFRCKVTFQAGASTCIYTPNVVAEQNRLTVNATPVAPTTTSAERCGAGSLVLSASGATTGQDYKWYADTTQSPIQVGGASFTTPSLATSTDYFVGIYQTSTSCESYKRKVSAIIKEIPTINLGSIAAICPSDLVFSLPYSQTTASPNKISILSADLPNFKNILDTNLAVSPMLISLPITKNSGTYSFVVSVKNTITSCKSVDYSLNLKIKDITKITKNPTSKAVCEGGNATFTVEATGEGTLYYQWRKDGDFIDGETSSSLNLTNISATDVGSYDCVVTSDCGIATSSAALLSMNLSVETLPQNQTVCEGADATFSISAIGSGTLSYQWKKNGVNIGTNAATLTLSNVQVIDNQAKITCEITAECGNITSNEVILTINPKPNLPSVVSPLGYCQNAVAGSLSAEASTGNTLVWYGNAATGGTPSSSPPNINTSVAGTFYYYVVQKDANNCESSRANIEVNITPSLVANLGLSPDKICATGLLNKEALLTAVASGGNGDFSYEWTKNSSTILGETASTYIAKEAAIFGVKVRSGNCLVEKNATITSILPELSVLPTCNDTVLCGVNTGTITATSTLSGGNFRWYDDATSTTVLSVSNPLTINGLSASKTYYVSYSKTLNSITCETARKAVLVEVKTLPIAPSITGTSAICKGEKAILQASGCVGGQIIWSTGESGASIEVSPTIQTNYTAKCKIGTCESANSEAFTVSVKPNPSIDLGTITSICNGASSFLIPYSNAINTPDIYSLTSTMPNFVTVTETVLPASPISVNIPSGKVGVHTFNLKLKGECENIQTFSVEILPSLTGGVIKATSATIYCAGYNPATISSESLASGGKTPYQYQWEVSSEGINYTEIVGATSSTYDPAGLSTTTYYRRKVTDACTEIAYSNTHQISIVPDPVVSITANKIVVCSGENIVLNETITEAGTGVCNTIWQSSNSASMTSAVEEGQGNSLTISYVNTTTSVLKKYLRAKYDCAASTCNLAYSNIIEVDILPIPQAPIISGVSKICSGSSTILKSSACSNGIVKWNTGEEKDSITVSTAGTYWAVCKNSACESAKSNEILVEVSGVLSPPTISGTSSICLGDSATLTASNCTGTILWSNGQTGASIKVSPSTTTSYTTRCQSLICTSAESNNVIITILPKPIITTQPKNDGDCKGNGVNLDVAASNTSTYQWQIRQVGGIFENISGANAARLAISSVGTSPYLDQTQYRVLLSNASCSTISDSATLTVNSITGQIPDQTICEGATDSVLFNLNNLTFTGQIKSYQWQKQSGSLWLDLAGKTANELIISPLSNADAGTYRCKITFYAGSSTCIRYSTEDDANGAILTIIGSQKPTISGVNLVCYGKSTTLTAANCTDGILTWSNGNTGNSTSISPISDTKYTVSCQNVTCGTTMVSDTFAVIVQNTPKPINTTPNNAILPNAITFSATGVGLKWYASASTSTVLAAAPTVSNAGTYTYWVSQTINGCESERLAITAHIYTNLAITQQPTDQYDCKGNGVNFPILVVGTGTILYKWQRKLPNESTFTDLVAGNGISGELTNNLKIS